MKISSLLRIFLTITVSVFSIPVPVFANRMIVPITVIPTDGSIVSGTGTIAQNGGETDVNITSSGLSKATWDSFSCSQGCTTDFNLANSSDTILNLVTGPQASNIDGNINSNGNVWLLNPNGIMFGTHAVVNVGSLLAGAGTMTVNNDGSWDFQSSGSSVINQGNITINHPGGYAALLGSYAENDGNITADQGTIALAAAHDMTVNIPLDNSINIILNSASQPSTTVVGNPYSALGRLVHNPAGLQNSGILQANGGNVLLKAYVNNLPAGAYAVNTTGTIMANSLNGDKGGVTLSANSDSAAGGGVSAGGSISTNSFEIDTPYKPISLSDGSITVNPTDGDAGITLIGLSIDLFNENLYALALKGNATIDLEGGDHVNITNSHLTAGSIAHGAGEINIKSEGAFSGGGSINISKGVLNSYGSSDMGAIDLSSGGAITVNSNSSFVASGQGAAIDIVGSGLNVSQGSTFNSKGAGPSGAVISFQSNEGDINLNGIQLNANASDAAALIDIKAGESNIYLHHISSDNTTFSASGESSNISLYASGNLDLGSASANTLSATASQADAHINLSGDDKVNIINDNINTLSLSDGTGSADITSQNGTVVIQNSNLKMGGGVTSVQVDAGDGLSISETEINNLSEDGDSSIELNSSQYIDISDSTMRVNSTNPSNVLLQGKGSGLITMTSDFDTDINSSIFSATGNTGKVDIGTGSGEINIDGSNMNVAAADHATIDISSSLGMNIADSNLNVSEGQPTLPSLGNGDLIINLSSEGMDLNNVSMDASSGINSTITVNSTGALSLEKGTSVSSEGDLSAGISLISSEGMNIDSGTFNATSSDGTSSINLNSSGNSVISNTQIQSQAGQDSSIKISAGGSFSELSSGISASSGLSTNGDAEVQATAANDINLLNSNNSATVSNNKGDATSDVSSTSGGNITLDQSQSGQPGSSINATSIGKQATASINGSSSIPTGDVSLNNSSALNANSTLGGNASALINGNNISLTKSNASSKSDTGKASTNINANGTFSLLNASINATGTVAAGAQVWAYAGDQFNLDKSSINATATNGDALANLTGGDSLQKSSMTNSSVNATSSNGAAGVTVADNGLTADSSGFNATASNGNSYAMVNNVLSGDKVTVQAKSTGTGNASAVIGGQPNYNLPSGALSHSNVTAASDNGYAYARANIGATDSMISAVSSVSGNAEAYLEAIGFTNPTKDTVSATANNGNTTVDAEGRILKNLSLTATSASGNSQVWTNGNADSVSAISTATGIALVDFEAESDYVTNSTLTATSTNGEANTQLNLGYLAQNDTLTSTTTNGDASASLNNDGNIFNSTVTAVTTNGNAQAILDAAGIGNKGYRGYVPGILDATSSASASTTNGNAQAIASSQTNDPNSLPGVGASTANGWWYKRIFANHSSGCIGSPSTCASYPAYPWGEQPYPSVVAGPAMSASSITQILSTTMIKPAAGVISVDPLSGNTKDSSITVANDTKKN